MKRILLYASLILAGGLFFSCDNGYERYDGVYIATSTGTNPLVTLIIDGEFPKEIDITVASTNPVEENVTVELITDPDYVSKYNAQFGTLFTALPETSYVLTHQTVTIEAGNYATTSPVKLKIVSSDEMVDGTRYMIPVRISKVSAGTKIIEGSSAIYAAMDQIIIGPALNVGTGYLTTQFNDPKKKTPPYDVSKLTKVSMEARVYMDTHSGLNTIFGLEEMFCVRVATENQRVTQQLELTGGGISNVIDKNQFPLKAWTHVAVVYDGDATGNGTAIIYVNGNEVANMAVYRAEEKLVNLHGQYLHSSFTGTGSSIWNHDSAPFWIGKSESGRPLRGSVSEAKIWAKALTPAEVRSNMCITDPKTPGLLAYWRFNHQDENGEFPDLGDYGFPMKLGSGSAAWMEDVMCPEDY